MPKRKSLFAEKKKPPPPPPPPPPEGSTAAASSSADPAALGRSVRNNDGHEHHDPMQDEATSPPGIPKAAKVASAVSAGMGPPTALAAGAAFGDVATGGACGRRGLASSGRGVRTRAQAAKAAPRPPARPPVRYVRGGGFGAVGYPTIDLELSSSRARFRRIDDYIREVDDEVAHVIREVAEVQAGLKREAEWYENRTQEVDREVQAAAADSATQTLQERLAFATEKLRQASEWSAESRARLAVWTERNEACKLRFKAVDRKRERIRLAIEKFRYFRIAALQAAAAPPRGDRAPHFDDDDSD